MLYLGSFLPDDRHFTPDWCPPWFLRVAKARIAIHSPTVPMTICPDGTYSASLLPAPLAVGSSATSNGLAVRQTGPTRCSVPAPDYPPGD